MKVRSCKRISIGAFAGCIEGLIPFDERVFVAPAKVNLRLKVLGRRPDGYHLLSMLNVSTSLSDELRVSLQSTPGCELQIRPETVLTGPATDNLVARAWHEFWAEFSSDGPPCGVRVVLLKKIPIGGGLGGGSSDAGAMLRFLVKTFGTHVCELCQISSEDREARVMHVALRIGADVPYAYRGGLCWVTGIGESVTLLKHVKPWLGEVLITVPPVSVPTVDFYRFFREQHPILPELRDRSMESVVSDSSDVVLSDLLENDFEADVVAFRPAVGEALRIAREYFPKTTSLTGSGAAIFSLVPPAGVGSDTTAFERRAEEAGMTVYRTRMVSTLD